VTPLVSVCIPTRDRAALLPEALRSALGQEGVELEVVVCDDASADDTPGVLASFADDRLRWVRSEVSEGVVGARERCLAVARGRYVAWLDSDDAYLPGALARQVAVLERRPGVALVHGGFEVVDEAGAPLPGWAAPFEQDTVEAGEVALGHLLASNEIITSTTVVRRDLLGAARSRTELPSSSDWAMWLRLAVRGDVAFTAAPIARYRQHRRTISHAATSGGERLRCDIAVARATLRAERGRLPDPRHARAVAERALAAKALLHAGDLFTRGDRRGSAGAVALAARLAPAPRMAALGVSTLRGDVPRVHRISKALLGRLATGLAGTRFGARVAAIASRDPAWDAALTRAAGAVRRAVPADACVGAVTKWDPSLLAPGATSPTAGRCPTATRPTVRRRSRTWRSSGAAGSRTSCCRVPPSGGSSTTAVWPSTSTRAIAGCGATRTA
jgi:glycosyltransferase involved in cell wall biosynthesis